MCHNLFLYNATAIANAKPAAAAPTGVPDASKKTDLLAGNVQNTSLVPALKSTTESELELLKINTKSVTIPVIASGGAGNLEHLYEAIKTGGASAVLAASIFHYGEFTIKETKEYLKSKNVPVRL